VSAGGKHSAGGTPSATIVVPVSVPFILAHETPQVVACLPAFTGHGRSFSRAPAGSFSRSRVGSVGRTRMGFLWRATGCERRQNLAIRRRRGGWTTLSARNPTAGCRRPKIGQIGGRSGVPGASLVMTAGCQDSGKRIGPPSAEAAYPSPGGSRGSRGAQEHFARRPGHPPGLSEAAEGLRRVGVEVNSVGNGNERGGIAFGIRSWGSV